VLAVLDRIVEMTEDDSDAVFVRHVEREELDHVEVFDLRKPGAV
jgi:hypothetical protein